MKGKIYIASALCLLMLSAGCVVSQTKISPNVKKMISLAQDNQASTAIDMFKAFTPEEYTEFESYLDENPDKISPFYYIAMADKVFEHDKDKAVFYYYFGKLRATEDVMMCKDTSARGQLGMYPMVAVNTLTYVRDVKMEDTQYFIDFMQKTLDWDNKYTKRVSPIWACYHGALVFTGKKPELLPDSEFPNVQKTVQGMVQKAIDARKDPTFAEKAKALKKLLNN